MDDLEAREEAGHHGLAVMGSLRELELAAEHRLIDFPTAIMKLQATSFHLPLPLVREMLARRVYTWSNDIRVVRRILGHQSPQSTKAYLKSLTDREVWTAVA